MKKSKLCHCLTNQVRMTTHWNCDALRTRLPFWCFCDYSCFSGESKYCLILIIFSFYKQLYFILLFTLYCLSLCTLWLCILMSLKCPSVLMYRYVFPILCHFRAVFFAYFAINLHSHRFKFVPETYLKYPRENNHDALIFALQILLHHQMPRNLTIYSYIQAAPSYGAFV